VGVKLDLSRQEENTEEGGSEEVVWGEGQEKIT